MEPSSDMSPPRSPDRLPPLLAPLAAFASRVFSASRPSSFSIRARPFRDLQVSATTRAAHCALLWEVRVVSLTFRIFLASSVSSGSASKALKRWQRARDL